MTIKEVVEWASNLHRELEEARDEIVSDDVELPEDNSYLDEIEGLKGEVDRTANKFIAHKSLERLITDKSGGHHRPGDVLRNSETLNGR